MYAMGSFRTYNLLICFMECVLVVICIEPHSQIKGNVKSLLQLTQWNWRHLNTSVKVDSPVSVDIALTSHYRLTGNHFTKYIKLQNQRDCASILRAIPNTKRRDGVYTIYPDRETRKLVYCDMTTDGGGWTVIQRRINGSVDFYRNWKSYKEGFGNEEGEYWIGNEVLHLLTTTTKQELRVDLKKFSGEKAYARYSTFSVGSESEKYKLTVGGYSGSAGDSLAVANGMKFTTKDQDNDVWDKHCGKEYHAGWWYGGCYKANPNGVYRKTAAKTTDGVTWYHFGIEYLSLQNTSLMIRSI